jgi:hypothetical protein
MTCNFDKGSFCYHWNDKIEDNIIIIQLVKIIKQNLKPKSKEKVNLYFKIENINFIKKCF